LVGKMWVDLVKWARTYLLATQPPHSLYPVYPVDHSL
jgi:hypothetical protein